LTLWRLLAVVLVVQPGARRQLSGTDRLGIDDPDLATPQRDRAAHAGPLQHPVRGRSGGARQHRQLAEDRSLVEEVHRDQLAERRRAAGQEDAARDDVEAVAAVTFVEDDLATCEPPPRCHPEDVTSLGVADRIQHRTHSPFTPGPASLSPTRREVNPGQRVNSVEYWCIASGAFAERSLRSHVQETKHLRPWL